MVIKKQIKNKFFKNKKNIRLDIFLNECLFKKNGYYYNKKAIGKHIIDTNDNITIKDLDLFNQISFKIAKNTFSIIFAHQ